MWYRRSKPGGNSKYIFIKDPDGYDIEILAALEQDTVVAVFDPRKQLPVETNHAPCAR